MYIHISMCTYTYIYIYIYIYMYTHTKLDESPDVLDECLGGLSMNSRL